jgi:hypothetical protein
MDDLEFGSPDRAAYTANGLLQCLDRLQHYAGKTPANLDHVKGMLAAIAKVCCNSILAHRRMRQFIGGAPVT